MLRYAPAAARRAAELGAHREAATQYERALRFATDQDPGTLATLYDAFAYEAGLLDRWQDAADAREQALALWRQVGDPLREGDTLRWLACSLCYLCRGSEGGEAGEAAIALLEPLGPTAELASAYSSLAAQRMVTSANEDAIQLARRAQAIARPLGLTRVLADALNTEACASHNAGGEWAGTIREALGIALGPNRRGRTVRIMVTMPLRSSGGLSTRPRTDAGGNRFCPVQLRTRRTRLRGLG